MAEDSDIVKLRALVAEMRLLGVTKYNGIELGPDPVQPETEQSDTKPESPEQRVRRERNEREALMQLTSGGLVPRLAG